MSNTCLSEKDLIRRSSRDSFLSSLKIFVEDEPVSQICKRPQIPCKSRKGKKFPLTSFQSSNRVDRARNKFSAGDYTSERRRGNEIRSGVRWEWCALDAALPFRNGILRFG
mmetsp:Transcript_18276/g.37790  ORF Transcript_18276/g.37790 Transcript_18276/m.37790 type:complete len:111 (-) Transcript_18276:291-623(-)